MLISFGPQANPFELRVMTEVPKGWKVYRVTPRGTQRRSSTTSGAFPASGFKQTELVI